MANYNEVINITVNSDGVLQANGRFKELNTLIKTIGSNTSGLNKVSNIFRNLVKVGELKNLRELKSVISEINSLANKKTEVKIGSSDVNKAINEVKKLTTAIETLSKTANQINIKINTSGIDKGTQSFKKFNQEADKANQKTIKPKVTTGNTGNGHTANIYGFDADRNATYQSAAAVRGATKGLMQMSEKFNVFGGNMAMLTSLMGIKSAKENLIDTPAKAEVNKYFAKIMQGDATGFSIYDTLDKATDQLPISMQNVVQPLYAFKSATGATAKEINEVVPDFANFGAQVINMTGSEERAETAMLKLAYAISTGDDKGRWEAVDQFGVNEKAVKNAKDANGNTLWNPTAKDQDVVGFMHAVTSVVGDAKDSMHNFNGMKQTVSKDFARAGKTVWDYFTGPLATGALQSYDYVDSSLGGLPSILLELGSAGLSVGSTLTQTLGSIGLVVANFGEVSGALRGIREHGGGLREAFKRVTVGAYHELTGNPKDRDYYSNYHNPQLAHIDSNVSRIANNSTRESLEDDINNIGGGSDNSSINGSSSNKKDKSFLNENTKRQFQEARFNRSTKPIEKLRQQELSALANSDKVMSPEYYARQQKKINKKYNKQIEDVRKSFGLLDEETSFLNKTFSSLGGIVTNPLFGILAGGALTTAIGLGMKAVKDSYNRNEKVRKAVNEASAAFDEFKSSLASGVGDVIGNWFYNGDTEGTEALDTAITDVAHNVKAILQRLGGTTEEQKELGGKNKSEAERFGYKDTDTEAVKQTKKSAIKDADFWYNLKKSKAHLRDQLLGTNSEDEIDAEYKDYITGVQNGDFTKSYGFLGAMDRGSGNLLNFAKDFSLAARIFGGGYNDNLKGVFDKEFEMTGVDWTDKTGWSYEKLFSRYMSEKGLGIAYPADIPRTEYDKMTPLEHTQSGLSDLFSKITSYFGNPSLNALQDFNNTSSTNPVIQAGNVELQGQNGNNNILGGVIDWITGGNGKGGSAVQNTAQNAQQGNPTNPQAINPALQQLNFGNMFQGVDFNQMGNQLITQLSQSLQTANLTSLGQGIMNSLNNSLMTMDMTSIGTTLSTQISSSIQNSFANTPIDLSGFFSGITGQISKHNGEFTTAGNTGGNNYKTGFGSGIGGTSGVASSEASEVLSALDIADQAYAKGQAAGKAFHEGFTSSGGDDIQSPGRAARAARDEGQYMLGFMNDTISPLYSTAQLMGSAMATGFARTGELSYSGVSLPQVNEQNTATGIFGSGGTSGNTYHLTQNVNIEKVDSRERAKEIAEYTVKMMKWNNETAGRSTEV